VSQATKTIIDIERRNYHGHAVSRATVIILPSYNSYYWGHAKWDGFTHAQWERAAAVNARYRRFARYLSEVKPGWQEVERIHYADNSVAVVEVSRDGVRRERTVVGPSGDACF